MNANVSYFITTSAYRRKFWLFEVINTNVFFVVITANRQGFDKR